MKSQKGVTLTSLVIYITLILIVLGILAVISGNFQNNIKEMHREGTNNSEIDKFNVYFLKEVKKQGNRINTISDNEILFTMGDKYTFKDDNCIYLNDNIKIAENIEKCVFSSSIENKKTVIAVTLKVIDGDERTIDYVLSNENYSIAYENEENYISTNKKEEMNPLPKEYQLVEYITFKNDSENGYRNFINTLVRFNEADKIEFTYKSVDTNQKIMFIAGYTTSPAAQPYLANDGMFLKTGFDSVTLTPETLTRQEISDGTKRTIKMDFTSSSTNTISFGSWMDDVWSRTIDWYSFEIWKGNTILRDFIPCYRKSDNKVGLYDLVTETLYINKGAGKFIAGPKI